MTKIAQTISDLLDNKLKDLPTKQDYKTLQTSVNKLETRFGTVETTVGKLDTKVGKMETTVGKLETTVGTLETTVGKLDTSVGTLETSFGKLETTVDKLVMGVADLKTEVATMKEDMPSKELIGNLYTVADKLTVITREYYDEHKVLKKKVDSMERVVEQAAPKLGLTYEH